MRSQAKKCVVVLTCVCLVFVCAQVPAPYASSVLVYMFNYGRGDPMPTFINATVGAGGVWKANGWLVRSREGHGSVGW